MNVLTLRLSCPVVARHIWNAVTDIHQQRKFATFQRIHCYVDRECGVNEEQLREQLDYCVRDGLLVIKKVGKKSKSNVKKEEYVFPTIFERDTHDWYCFECHLPGEIICCSTCYRVYHTRCIATMDKTSDEFVCNICKTSENNVIGVERLNYLLSYEFNELTKGLPYSTILWKKNKPKMLNQYLIFNPVYLDSIWEKISSIEYHNLAQFRVDIQTVLHNVSIYEGKQSCVTLMVKDAVNDCIRNIKDIRLCADCYQMSHEKSDEFWFCKPCDPPHELVYAQVNRFPYWPAKVIEKINDQYDVRFFGTYHQRAIVEKDCIRPISENINKLPKLPKTASWQKAYKELKLHQLLLASSHDPGEVQRTKEIIKKSENKKRKMRGKVLNKEKKSRLVTNDLSSENINKYSLSTPLKRGINSKRKKIAKAIQRRKKGKKKENGVRNKEVDHSTTLPKASSVNDSDVLNIPTKVNVDIQTTCIAEHGHRNYILDQEKNESFKFSEENYDCNELVTRIMNTYNEEQKRSKDEPDHHAFCNVKCPLNKGRKNIVSDNEIQEEIKKALSEATNIINTKYGEIVDNMVQNYKIMVSEVHEKIWCIVCRNEADTHCCWGVDYCSQKCRDEHWESGHCKNHEK